MPSSPSPAAERDGISLRWYAVALVVYIIGGYFLQSILLNWIVGPLFLFVALYVVPALARTVIRAVRKGPTT